MARKQTELDQLLASAEPITSASLHGTRATDRYTEDELARLAGLPLEKVSLLRHPITRLPPALAEMPLRWLWLGESPSLVSLDGIERLVSLQTLWLTDVPNLDLERACDLLAELPELAEVRLGGATFRRMPRGIVKLHSALEVRLEDCPELDFADAFAQLARVDWLRRLGLVQRTPVQLPDALAPLTRIETLELLFGFSALPPSIGAMTNLQKLDLERNHFRALPPTLGKLDKLRELDVRGSKLVALPDELCDCAALEVLNVHGNPLKALPERIGALAKLVRLEAGGTKLKTVPPSIGELANLRYLSLPWHGKLAVPESLYRLELVEFHGPSEIQDRLTLRPAETPQTDRVYLYEAERLPADFGDPLELELRLHDLTAPLPQLSQLRRLREVTIDTGNLDDALARLAHAPRLEQVRIEGERETLPASLGDLVHVKTLAISSSPASAPSDPGPLVALPEAIGKLVHLVYLHVGPSRLTALPEAIGELAALETLDLDVRALAALPPAIGKLARLTSLVLRLPYKLARLPDELARCRALESVKIYGWYSVPFPIENLALLGQLPALRMLELSRWKDLPLAPLVAALAGGPLEELDLSSTEITELPPEIGALAKLRTLRLESTNLKRFPAELRACTHLRWISVPLYTLDDDVREAIKDHLPKGRWKKMQRTGVHWYERSDA